MSQKRKRTEQADGDHHAQAPTRKRPFIPGKGHGKLKPKRPDNGAESKGTSISELKSRIRNLRRLLEHVESEPKHRMPANVRIERVRELATCQHELAEKTAAVQEAERRRNMVSKYHHIRFFGGSPALGC
jgi:type VI protein secretion system component VasF